MNGRIKEVKKIKRMIAVILLVFVVLVGGYASFTCSRTTEILTPQGEQTYESD